MDEVGCLYPVRMLPNMPKAPNQVAVELPSFLRYHLEPSIPCKTYGRAAEG